MAEKFDVLKFKDGEFSLDVRFDFDENTLWLTQSEIANLFDVDRTRIVRHTNDIYKDGELDERTTCAESAQVRLEGKRKVKRNIRLFNLDLILSIAHRVRSKRGNQFRIWANSVLKDYLIKGYAVNERRLISLNKTIEIQNRMLSSVLNIETSELSSVISAYTDALDLLDDYDHQCVKPIKGRTATYVLTYDDARGIINSMKFGGSSNIFGVEKETGKLNGILAAVYQNVFGKEIYETLEDKAAHLLYFLVKDHPFVDGCKRIAATLFLEFLNRNHALVKEGKLVISNDALVAITLLTAESKPEEIEMIIKIIVSLLAK
mgnify:CR=1 FL=1